MSGRLEGKVAIVTGSGQGIGRAIAIELAREGAAVVTNSRKRGTEGGDAYTTAEQIEKSGGKAAPFFCDVSDFNKVGSMVEFAVKTFGGVHILVNCAGADAPRMVWNMSEEEWDKCVNSFLKGSFNCIRHVAPILREQRWGRIVNLTSSAWLGTVGHCNYGAAKAGVVGLTRAVAREMGRYGVTCNAIAPLAATRFIHSKETLEGLKKRLEAGLITKEQYEEVINLPGPEYIAPFAVYLCTEEAWNINGQVFDVKGGFVSIYSEPIKAKTIYKDGKWTLDELIKLVPKYLLEGYKNPAPPEKK